MTGFSFDAQASLRRARASGSLPILPNLPNRDGDGTAEIGGIGGIGTVADFGEVIALALDHFEERAAIAQYDGGLSRAEAERRAARDQGFTRAAALLTAAEAGGG